MISALEHIRAAGIPITWEIVRTGWEGPGQLGRQLNLVEVQSFAQELIGHAENEALADLADIITVNDDSVEVGEILGRLAPADPAFSIRVWRAYLLEQLLATLPPEPIDSLSELTDFWAAFGYPEDSPHVVQGRGDARSPQDYYTEENRNRLINEQRVWLEKEWDSLRHSVARCRT